MRLASSYLFGHLFPRSFSPPHLLAPSHPLPARAVLLPRGKRAVLPASPLPASSATAASLLFSPTPPNTEAAVRQSSSQISQIPSRTGPSPSTPITARQAEHCRPCTLLALPPRQSTGSGEGKGKGTGHGGILLQCPIFCSIDNAKLFFFFFLADRQLQHPLFSIVQELQHER